MSTEMTQTTLNDEQIVHLFQTQLPNLLERRPDLEPQLLNLFFKTFATKSEVVGMWQELVNTRAEVQTGFERSDERFDQLEKRQTDLEYTVKDGFKKLERQISQLGSRWGIHTEELLRQTMITVLTGSFGATVEEAVIEGEQFDIIIKNGEHILIEITASVKRNIKERLERKRDLYITATGITPTRVILAVGSIHPKRYNSLIEAGFEVIMPDNDDA